MEQHFDYSSNESHFNPRSFDTHSAVQDMSTDPIVLTAYRNADDTLVPSDQTNTIQLAPTTPSNNEGSLRTSSHSLRAKLLRLLHFYENTNNAARTMIPGSSINSSEEYLFDDTLWNRVRKYGRRFFIANLRWVGLSVAMIFAVSVMITFLVMLDDPKCDQWGCGLSGNSGELNVSVVANSGLLVK